MISGGIKFLKQSKILNASAIASVSGNASVSALLDSNRETFYRSISSDDTITEIIEITFSELKTIDRLFLKDFNWKEFNVKYDLSSVWTDFSNVIDVDGSQATISETVYSNDTYYAEFDSVTTDKIKIEITKTQVVDAEKFINQVIVTEELSTLVGYPEIKSIKASKNLRRRKTVSGKFSIQKSLETFGVKLTFKDYPSSDVYNVDIDAAMELHDSENPFLVWLCGGKFGSKYFKYTIRGFRLKDIFQVQLSNDYSLSYTQNIYINQVNIASVDLMEHI